MRRRDRLARRPRRAGPGRVGVDGASIAFVASPSPPPSAILLWQRWDWLALGAFVVSAPQLLAWVRSTSSGTPTTCVLGIAVSWSASGSSTPAPPSATSCAARRGELPVASWLLLLGSCVACRRPRLRRSSTAPATTPPRSSWIFGFAAVHVGLGGSRSASAIHREIGSLLIGIGIALAPSGSPTPSTARRWSRPGRPRRRRSPSLGSRLDATPGPGALERRAAAARRRRLPRPRDRPHAGRRGAADRDRRRGRRPRRAAGRDRRLRRRRPRRSPASLRRVGRPRRARVGGLRRRDRARLPRLGPDHRHDRRRRRRRSRARRARPGSRPSGP